MVPNKSEPQLVEQFETQHRPTKAAPWKYELVYPAILNFTYIHLSACYGFYLTLTSAKWCTIVFCIILYIMAVLGVTAGTHRLWSHKSFKATKKLQITLLIFQMMSGEFPVTRWVADHKLHHIYCDTDGDPHNSSRGLFYSHIGWLLVKPHPEVVKGKKKLNMTELLNDPLLKFQRKYWAPLVVSFSVVIPALISTLWGEPLWDAWNIQMFRVTLCLHAAFFVNSLAHAYGYKPYDKEIHAAMNIATCITALGEGFHNYHHTFPWDYRAAELGNNRYNITTLFIDFMAKIGWAYDLKTVPEHVIAQRMKRTGDGTDLWGHKREDLEELRKAAEDIKKEYYYTHDFDDQNKSDD